MPSQSAKRKNCAKPAPSDVKELPRLAPLEVSSLFVPLELFVRIMEELSNEDRVNMSHVSRARRKAILTEPRLWRDLEVDLGNAEVSLERTKIYLDRSEGKLHSFR